MSIENKNSRSSWIQLTNETPTREGLNRIKSAHHDKGSAIKEEKLERVLKSIGMTQNPEANLRDECFLDGQLASWGDIQKQFIDYINDKDGLTHILRNLNDNSKLYIENSHRFEEDYKNQQMAKFYAVERKSKEYYENPKTVMITLSASPYYDNGDMVNPVDHINSIMDRDAGSWNTVKTAFQRVLEDYDSEYMRILEPHTPDKGTYEMSGFAHQHLGIVVDDPDDELTEDMFKPALESHIRNCKTAGKEAHTVENSVSIFEEDEDKDGSLGSYLTAYLGETLDQDPRDADPYFKRFLSLLWASNRRRVGFSNGANEWVREDYKDKYEEDEDEDEGEELPSYLKSTEDEMDKLKEDIDIKRYEYWGIGFKQDNGEIEEHEVEISCGGSSYTSTVKDAVNLGEEWHDNEADVSHWWTDSL